jgi:hypothetical protein
MSNSFGAFNNNNNNTNNNNNNNNNNNIKLEEDKQQLRRSVLTKSFHTYTTGNNPQLIDNNSSISMTTCNEPFPNNRKVHSNTTPTNRQQDNRVTSYDNQTDFSNYYQQTNLKSDESKTKQNEFDLNKFKSYLKSFDIQTINKPSPRENTLKTTNENDSYSRSYSMPPSLNTTNNNNNINKKVKSRDVKDVSTNIKQHSAFYDYNIYMNSTPPPATTTTTTGGGTNVPITSTNNINQKNKVVYNSNNNNNNIKCDSGASTSTSYSSDSTTDTCSSGYSDPTFVNQYKKQKQPVWSERCENNNKEPSKLNRPPFNKAENKNSVINDSGYKKSLACGLFSRIKGPSIDEDIPNTNTTGEQLECQKSDNKPAAMFQHQYLNEMYKIKSNKNHLPINSSKKQFVNNFETIKPNDKNDTNLKLSLFNKQAKKISSYYNDFYTRNIYHFNHSLGIPPDPNDYSNGESNVKNYATNFDSSKVKKYIDDETNYSDFGSENVEDYNENLYNNTDERDNLPNIRLINKNICDNNDRNSKPSNLSSTASTSTVAGTSNGTGAPFKTPKITRRVLFADQI